jgi:hypothetical protein
MRSRMGSLRKSSSVKAAAARPSMNSTKRNPIVTTMQTSMVMPGLA